MSTRNISLGVKVALPPLCADCLEVWEFEPPRTLRTCTGISVHYVTILSCIWVTRLLRERIKEFYVVYFSGEQSMGHWTSQCDPLANFSKISYKYILMCVLKVVY